jgi:hypothetical protein
VAIRDQDEPDDARPSDREERADDEEPGAEGAEEDSPQTPVPRVWDRPDDRLNPPSQRPEDTHEEARRRRKAG